MLKLQIEEKEILINLIAMFNLLEKELCDLVEKLGLNYLEFSILVYISNNDVTQYKISKKFKISIQRAYQIVKKLLTKDYIEAKIEQTNGRASKSLFTNLKSEKKIEEVNNEIISRFIKKKIDPQNLEDFNSLIKKFIVQLESN
ncbi:MAG: MarR family transcriptional regulator [Fusobacteriaceae bacterium]